MSDESSTWPILASVIALACLAGNAAAWVLLVRWFVGRERRIERRLDELEQWLTQLEVGRDHARRGAVDKSRGPEGTSAASPRASGRPPDSPMGPGGPREDSNRPTLISVPDLGHDGQPADPQLGGELSQKHQAVWALSAEGYSPEEIARRTSQPIGEVELIVGLQRSLQPARGATPHVRSE